MISSNLLDYLSFSDHLVEVKGSDHCPVYADLTIEPMIHTDQMSDINCTIAQPSVKDFFKKSDKSLDLAQISVSKKQRRVSDYFSKPKEPERASASVSASLDSFTEIIQFNKKLKKIINTVAPKERDGIVGQWDQLFTPKPPPDCHHKEPCKEFKTKIKGPNTGR